MPIYTKRGDKGRTDLFSGERVHKDDPRTEAYGTIDELNAVIGRAMSWLDEDELIDELETVQNQLHICQTDLSNTEMDDDHPRIQDDHVDWLEEVIDRHNEELPDLEDFLLQGGAKAASELFVARAVCRRAERRLVTLSGEEEVNAALLKYVNRLGDLLFVLARTVNHRNDVDEKHPTY
ncbi:MAG: cob(I)yrinic acid a,c-diamide adenosyltransferase [Candidatus Nanohaloarchaea archaeon]|nr:cob(I)yrinic acid a,c-diamide adenosyltransferase [Candidatus Nanohaloarchaea archaeon]